MRKQGTTTASKLWTFLAWCEPSKFQCRPSTGHRRWSKAHEGQLQCRYFRGPALKRCGWYVGQHQRAIMDCRPPLHASHSACRRSWYYTCWGYEDQQTLDTSSALVRGHATFVDTRQAFISYAREFHLQYGVRLVDQRIEHIFDDNLSSECLPTGAPSRSLGYIRFAKLFINKSDLLPLYERLSTEGGTGKSLGILNVDCSVLYSSERDEVILMVDPEPFIKNHTKSILIYDPFSYSKAISALIEMSQVKMQFSSEVHLYFLYFMSLKVQGQLDSSLTVKQLFFNNTCLLNYDPRDKDWRWEDNGKKRKKRLVFRVPKPPEPQTLAPAPYVAFLAKKFQRWT